MKVTEVTFSVGKKTSLNTYTGIEEDRYANVNPHASAKVELDAAVDPKTPEGKAAINDAYVTARGLCLEQLTQFHNIMLDSFKRK